MYLFDMQGLLYRIMFHNKLLWYITMLYLCCVPGSKSMTIRRTSKISHLFKVSHTKKTKKMKKIYDFLFSRYINVKYVYF